MEIAGLILDLLLIALLAATVFFVLRLHNKLEVIRGGKGDLEALLRELVDTTVNAERSLSGLRANAIDLSETLGKQTKGAENASEELSYLLASADNKAKQLLAAVENAKPGVATATAAASAPAAAAPASPLSATPAATPAATPTNTNDKRQQAEQDLLKAIEKLR